MIEKPWPPSWVPGVALICCVALETPSPLRITSSLNEALGSLMAHRAAEARHPQGITWGAAGVNQGLSSQDHPWLARRRQVPPPPCWLSLSPALTQREGRAQVLRLWHPQRQTACASLLHFPLPSMNPLPSRQRREPLPSGVWSLTLDITVWGSLSKADQHWISTPPLPGR